MAGTPTACACLIADPIARCPAAEIRFSGGVRGVGDEGHMVRNSLNFVPWKVRKEIAAVLKLACSAATADDAGIRTSGIRRKK
jgi:hypothetical protein